MLTDQEILDAVPHNQGFDDRTKWLWFGRFIESVVISHALAKQDRLRKEWAELWGPIDAAVRPITPIGESVPAKALELINSAKGSAVQPENAIPDQWRLTGPGQIKAGDYIIMTIAGRRICKKAKEVIDPGKASEEVVYNRRKNHYFITSMVFDGTSNHKDVFIIPG